MSEARPGFFSPELMTGRPTQLTSCLFDFETVVVVVVVAIEITLVQGIQSVWSFFSGKVSVDFGVNLQKCLFLAI